jgi:hypothetical protein
MVITGRAIITNNFISIIIITLKNTKHVLYIHVFFNLHKEMGLKNIQLQSRASKHHTCFMRLEKKKTEYCYCFLLTFF